MDEYIWLTMGAVFLLFALISIGFVITDTTIYRFDIPKDDSYKSYILKCLTIGGSPDDVVQKEITDIKFNLCSTQDRVNEIINRLDNPFFWIRDVVLTILSSIGCILSWRAYNREKKRKNFH